MPFWKPGSLTEDESWRVTAFILRENDLWDDTTELNASNASAVRIPRGTLTPVATPQPAQVGERGGLVWIVGIGILISLLLLMLILKKSRNTTTI
jgi:hypothetical protein